MATATLTTITPVHVGSGQKLLRNFDFVVDNGKFFFIDLEKIGNYLGGNKASIEKLVTAIEQKTNPIQFLKQFRGLQSVDISVFSYKVSPKVGSIQPNTNELKEQIFSTLKGPLIPGSSLKGAIKTAILKFLTAEERIDKRKQQELVRKVRWENRKSVNFNILDKVLFGEDANSKSTRFLLVGDAHFSDTSTEIHELSYLNLTNPDNNTWRWEGNKAQFVECIPANKASKFEFKIQSKLLEAYERKYREAQAKVPADTSIKKLKDISFLKYPNAESGFLSIINNSTKSLLNWEINKLKDKKFANKTFITTLEQIEQTAQQCKEGEAVIRVGAHVGWHFMTGRWIVFEPDVLSDQQFDLLQEASQRTERYVGIMFPKTRKYTSEAAPLGFVKISLTP